MTYIIINADDFGLSDGICRSTFELLDAGAISGTSLMCAANGARDRLREWDVSKLRGFAGVHLQLSGGRPISPPEDVPSLIDPATKGFRRIADHSLPDPAHVELEWRRQVETTYAALGAPPTHLDSHHGVHRIPEIFEIYVRLALELGLPIRGAAGDITRRMRVDGIPGTIALVREWTGRSLGLDALTTMILSTRQAHPDEGVMEIVSHPGYSDDDLRAVSSLAEGREDDHRTLLQLAENGWLADHGFILTSHAGLAPEWHKIRPGEIR